MRVDGIWNQFSERQFDYLENTEKVNINFLTQSFLFDNPASRLVAPASQS